MNNYYIHDTSIVDENVHIGEHSKIWHWCHISKNVFIGSNCNIGQNIYIGEDVKIGNNVKIQNNVSIYSGVKINDFVFCGPNVTFTNDINPRSEYSKNKKFIKTFVDTGSTIGANSTLICGIKLGKYCFIGAGSVVTKDVKPYSLVLGNPAKHLYWVSRAAQKLVFKDNKAYCLKSNTKYKIENDQCVIL